MKNRGFTLVELITTFALSAVIIVILINVVLIIKDMSSDSKIKTKLIVNQSRLSNALNSKISSDNLISYRVCNTAAFCYNFTLSTGEIIKIEIDDKTIKVGNYAYDIDDGVTVSNPEVKIVHVDVSDTKSNNSFLVIKIPIIHKLYPNTDFGINLVYPYNSNIQSL